MDPPPQVVSLLDCIDDKAQFSVESIDPIEILSKFMSLTEFPGILSLPKESKIPEEFLVIVKNHIRVFFLSEVSFTNTVELKSQVSTFWEEVDTGVSIYLDSQPVGNRKRLYSSTSEGNFYFQEFLIDTGIIPAERISSLRKDERSKSLLFKLQNNHLCELIKFPPWGITPNMIKTTGLKQDYLPLDLLFNLCTMTSADAVVRCTSVCKLWYAFLRVNYLALQRISNDRILGRTSSSYLHECKLKFFVLVKPDTALGIPTPTAYMGSYDRDANTFRISKEPLWLPQISNSGFRTQVIGSVKGVVCVVGTQGFDLSEPITLFNPLTKTSLYLPSFRRRYKSYRSCVSGFGFVPEIKRYRLVRVVYPGKYHHQVIHTFTVGVNKQWVYKGFLPEVFGPLLANGVFVDKHLYFKDAYGNIAAYHLSTEMFTILTSPPIDMREEDGIRSSSLCSNRNKLAVVVFDFIKNMTSIWLLEKSTRTAAATSIVWKPVIRIETSFASCKYSLVSFTSDVIVWLVDGKRIVSHKTVEVGVQEELLVYSQGLISEIVGHCLTYLNL